MNKKVPLTFNCAQNQEEFFVHLEPYANQFKVKKNTTLQLKPKKYTDEFYWEVIEENGDFQVIPDPPESYEEIEVYRNNILIGNEFDGEWKN